MKLSRKPRVFLDTWLARIGKLVGWVWGVFWAMIGVVGLGMAIFKELDGSIDIIMPLVSLGLAALHYLLIRFCNRTSDLVLDFHLYCSFFAREQDKSIPALAAAMHEPEQHVMGQLKEMCRRGYFNGFIDYQQRRMIFSVPQEPADADAADVAAVAYCPGCGARNAVSRHGQPCRYCGAPLSLEAKKSEG